MSSVLKKRLIELIIEKAFKYSEEPVFKLVSGRMSNYYFNCKASCPSSRRNAPHRESYI